jgi:hypothetical protein
MNRIAFFICLALGTSLIASPAFAADGTLKIGACYGKDYTRAEGPLRSVRAVYNKTSAKLTFSQWDVPNFSFNVFAFCRDGTDRVGRCGVECDGGQLEIIADLSGRLALIASNLRFAAEGLPSRQAGDETDSGTLTETFMLDPMPEDKACEAFSETVWPVLEAGDAMPVVLDIETALNQLGYLLETPDPVFSAVTAKAVSEFQSAYDLASTGKVDATTSLLLKQAASIGGGC